MNAKEYLLDQLKDRDQSEYKEKSIEAVAAFMEAYHKHKLASDGVLSDVGGSAKVDINIQVEILKKVINKLMITFDDENDRMDYILDICNEYRKQAEKHCH